MTIYGVYQMLQVVRFASMTLLQGTDDLLLRGLAGLDRVRGGLGDWPARRSGAIQVPNLETPAPRSRRW